MSNNDNNIEKKLSGKESSQDNTAEIKKEFVIEDIEPFVYKNKDVLRYKKNKTKKAVVLLVTVLFVVVGLSVCYLAGVKHRMKLFAGNTTINGVNVSGKTVEEAMELLNEACGTYTMKIKFKNGEETLKVGDGNLNIVFDYDIQELLEEQNPYLWIFQLGADYTYSIGYELSYTDEGIKAYIDSLPEMDETKMIPSKDAVIIMRDGEVDLISDEEGTMLNKDKVFDLILGSLEDGVTAVDLAAHNCYVSAEVDSNTRYVRNGLESAKRFLGIKGSYKLDGETIVEITPQDLCNMAHIDDNGDVVVEYDKVAEYVDSIADLFPKEKSESKQVDFLSHTGEKKKVSTTRMDWSFDSGYETDVLFSYLEAMTDFERIPRYKSVEVAVGSAYEVGDTYLELDLGEQHVYYYKKGKVIFDADCVSGCIAWNMGTPSGFYIMGKPETDARLVGEYNSYDTRVEYWMPFINQEIGLHDASWKTEFGGDIYMYDGSHGCINLSTEDAKKLYGMVYEGLPVIVYY